MSNANGLATTQPAHPVQILQREFEKWKPSLTAVLPAHLKADRIVKMALAAFMRSDDLQKCTVVSVIKATIMAAELGLEPGGLLGEAYLVPFNTKKKVRDGNTFKDVPVTEATLIPGYKGLIKLARQSGDVSTIGAYVVDEKDLFDVQLGTEQTIKHVPNFDARSGKMRAVYAVIKFKDGGVHFEVMTRADVEAVKSRSKASGSGPWVSDFNEMAKKTVIKRAMKMVTLSPERAQLAIATAADNAYEDGQGFSTETADALDAASGEAAPPPKVMQQSSRTSILGDKLASKVADAEFVDSDTGEVHS